MSKVCSVCNRGPQTGYSVSHSKISTKRKFNINLQTKKIDGKKRKVCTKCIKTMSKVA